MSAISAGADIGFADGIHIHARIERAACRIIDFESVQRVQRIFSASSGDVKLAHIVLNDAG